jgi:adenylate cyclase
MTPETTTLAVLFADIAKSTHLYEVLGNQTAQSIIGSCLELLSQITKFNNGTVIKTIGDELMCTFPTATDAVEAAKEMHQDLEELEFAEKPGFTPPNLYVGIQVGSVIHEDGDVFGDAVNVAARMVGLANQRQIITTQETVDALPSDYEPSLNCIDKITVKGKSGEMNIYEMVWEEHDVTVMMDDIADSPVFKCRMEITHKGQAVDVDENKPSCTLGRQVHNDLVCRSNRVSRSHARVEYRRGKFVLVDQSSNGTYVMVQGKKSINVKRDETPLIGNGVIGLGQELTADSPDAILFAIKM